MDKDTYGRTLLHLACEVGSLRYYDAIIRDVNANVAEERWLNILLNQEDVNQESALQVWRCAAGLPPVPGPAPFLQLLVHTALPPLLGAWRAPPQGCIRTADNHRRSPPPPLDPPPPPTPAGPPPPPHPPLPVFEPNFASAPSASRGFRQKKFSARLWRGPLRDHRRRGGQANPPTPPVFQYIPATPPLPPPLKK